MDELENKKLEALVNKMMEDAPLDSPSVDFTQNVMQKIVAEAHNEVFQYKPIVSGKVLSFIFIAFTALLIYLGSQVGLDSGQGWFKDLHVETWFQANWDWMGHYNSSKVMVYGFLFLGLMFFAQVPWLKKQLNKTAF
ncbi:hypothetical protein D2V08_09220 [Flagellimonas lutimaris]|uniref:Uncharacterized protein n=1 Tax=Flagellimonas lutimaris TaxID=475082 RepID=A0A3A1N9F6_9FLAO|nr:hypothetical protein [Allomuricauda lutimaris]RIV34201.1 hypothetical protein D2V08_09220 [Allomuricauda lutimaris]|tara:strand:- start:306 stop:716 length:411 start_codon:yes stop_codon:yes gene_type:complete